MFIVLKYKCHGVSVLMVLVSLSQQAATLKSSFSSPYSTGADDDEDNNEERRGGGQDGDEDSGPSPRPALHEDLGSAFTKLAARKRKDRLLSAQKDPFLAELGDDVCSQDPLRALTGGCWRPPEEHREPRPLAPAASSARPRDSSPATRPAGRGTASGPPAIATCNILGYTSRSQLSSGCGVRSTPPDGVYRLHGGEARQPGLRPARQPLQQLPDCQESPRHRHGSEDPSWGRQCSGIVCCFRHNNNALSYTRAAVFRGMQPAAPQFAIGRRKALLQGWGAKNQLKIIQRDGYDTDTDVRDSLEIQEVEKERRKAMATPYRHRPEEGDRQLGVCLEQLWWIVFV